MARSLICWDHLVACALISGINYRFYHAYKQEDSIGRMARRVLGCMDRPGFDAKTHQGIASGTHKKTLELVVLKRYYLGTLVTTLSVQLLFLYCLYN